MTLPSGIRPMLATSGVMPSQDGWQYEIKWDGVRAVTYVEDGRVIRMESRNLKDFTPRYPEVCEPAAVPAALRGRSLVLDGEVVGFDERGRVSFGALQHRMHLSTERAARQKRASHPVAYMVFDLLWLDGDDLTSRPVEERRAALVDLGIGGGGLWQVPPVVAGSLSEGEALREASQAQGLEGIVAKRLGSPYEIGRRSRNWLKIKNKASQEMVIGGWLGGEGNRSGSLGALLVGHHSPAGLHYAGRVGTGFTFAVLRNLLERLQSLERESCPFVDAPRLPKPHWVDPVLVAQVSFTEWTSGGTLRHPVYMGLREDVDASRVVREPVIGEN